MQKEKEKKKKKSPQAPSPPAPSPQKESTTGFKEEVALSELVYNLHA